MFELKPCEKGIGMFATKIFISIYNLFNHNILYIHKLNSVGFISI